MRPLTPRQRDAVEAYLVSGSVRDAAHRMGVKPLTARVHLQNARERVGAVCLAQLVYLVRDELDVPELRRE